MEKNKVLALKIFIPGGRNRHRYKNFKNVGDAVIKEGIILETLEFEMREGAKM